MSPVSEAHGPPVVATVKTRKKASLLTAQELEALKAAVSQLQDFPDTRGWQYFAGWHWVPEQWCEHYPSELFLPWHRSYLYHLEIALQTSQPEVTLPWWDWIAEGAIPSGYDGHVTQNPLGEGGPIKPVGATPQPSWPTETSREPGAAVGTDPSVLPLPLQGHYDWLMAPKDFKEFSRRLAMLHNNVHVWTGGTMGQVPWAAYDPVFFAHHAMVDRLWRIWQDGNPGALPPVSLLDKPLRSGTKPIFTVREVLDVQALGYDYADSSSSAPGTIGGN
jgi:tyrosinase